MAQCCHWCYITALYILIRLCFSHPLRSNQSVRPQRHRCFSLFQVVEPQFGWTSSGVSGVLPRCLSGLLNLSVINENSISSLLIYDHFFISRSTNQFCLRATAFSCCNQTLITDMVPSNIHLVPACFYSTTHVFIGHSGWWVRVREAASVRLRHRRRRQNCHTRGN